ncbi:hypothetical protein BO99DRAFT_458708 [Aspergillus violaceofuscus CBS 115571]|uniref:Uncharacterized protein n=1 Tax=Aspergillus violaceofuscus (strain CBS 115571) TaxID=1450538 RepID=A0A2V5HB31_ASPV1|nr:hypothetical protein BO99DRAFT_458708 [Aspergillus violaceofuscus CBS 115571]
MLDWNIPSSQSSCQAQGYNVTCNFALYTNATDLTTAQKLSPNTSITGPGLVKVFIITSVVAIGAAFVLLIDKACIYWNQYRDTDNAIRETRYYRRIAHTVEQLLHTLSDQQLTTGFALIFALSEQACTISAYHYDLVCAMLLMSFVTHLNTLVSIPTFIHKGKLLALYRCAALIAQVVLISIIFSARNRAAFPVRPSSLAIMPACCLMNMNASDWLGLAEAGEFVSRLNSTENNTSGTEIFSQAGQSSAFGQYIALIVFTGFTAVIAGVNWLEAREVDLHRWLRWVKLFVAAAVSVATLALTVWAYQTYNSLRAGMEVEEWYQLSKETTAWTFAEIVPLALLASTSITLVKALTQTLEGVDGPRYEGLVQVGVKRVAVEVREEN